MKFNRASIVSAPVSAPVVSAAVAHALAWIAFLWLAFWPYSYRGVSATPVQVDELGNPVGTAPSEVVRYSASFVEANGLEALVPLLIPVTLTGLALIVLLTWRIRRVGIAFALWLLTVVLLAFCLLGYLSFGVLYVPAALALIVAAAILSFRRRLPRVPQE